MAARAAIPAVLSATTLIGDAVQNRKGESLGQIEELMLDLTYGRIAYAVLSFGGFLGMGDKLFAVPWEALELDTPNRVFILDVEKEALQNTPGFDKDDWPQFADPTWGGEIYAHYEIEPYWQR